MHTDVKELFNQLWANYLEVDPIGKKNSCHFRLVTTRRRDQ